MDHRRIDWLFLIVFVLIDIYLAFEILRSPVNLGSVDTSDTSTSSIKMEMRADGIDLPAKISENQASGYYMAIKNRDYLSGKISDLTKVNATYSKSDNSITATPKLSYLVTGKGKAAIKALNTFKNDPHNVPYGKQYVYEPSMSGSGIYTFVQKSEYGKIYDSSAQLVITVKDKVIDSYMLTYIGPVSPVRELQSTISPWHAIKAMYLDRELANNSRIVRVKLAYSKLTVVRGSTIFLPTWLVWVENKTTKNTSLKRVNAFTSQVLPASSTYSLEK